MSYQEEAQGRPGTSRRDYISPLAWGHLGVGGGTGKGSGLVCCLSDPATDKGKDAWMDGNTSSLNLPQLKMDFLHLKCISFFCILIRLLY